MFGRIQDAKPHASKSHVVSGKKLRARGRRCFDKVAQNPSGRRCLLHDDDREATCRKNSFQSVLEDHSFLAVF